MTPASEPTVIVVNFNGGDRLTSLLDALANQTAPHRTIVVDNASSDDSARGAYNRYPNHTYLPLRYNRGFARGANIGVSRVDSDLIILLNPDTVPSPTFVAEIIDPFGRQPEVAAVAGTLVFETNPEIIASAGIRIHRNGVALDHLLGCPLKAITSEEVFGASGGAAAYRRAAFIEAGGFPSVFFMYQEDADLAFRLQLRGWSAINQPAAVATHAYSASAGEGSPFKSRLIARNRIWTLARCLPSRLWRDHAVSILSYDAAAIAYGLALDPPAASGRAEAWARILPRLCERRQIAPDNGDVERIERWMEDPVSLSELRRLRSLTARLAARG